MQSDDERTIVTNSEIDLEKHFRSHGMSSRGYLKLKNDIDNGDMSVDVLIEFDENELIKLSNEYNLSTLQKKAFIKAVKLLPKSKAVANDNDDIKNNLIFVTPQEQSIMNDINKFQKILNDYSKQCKNVQSKNKNVLISTIKKLENCGKLIKETIDNVINTLVQKVCKFS